MPEPHEAVSHPALERPDEDLGGLQWSSTDRLAPAGTVRPGRHPLPIAIRSDSTYLSTRATRWGLPMVTAVNSSAGRARAAWPRSAGSGNHRVCGVKSTAGCSRPIWRTPSGGGRAADGVFGLAAADHRGLGAAPVQHHPAQAAHAVPAELGGRAVRVEEPGLGDRGAAS